MLPGWGHGVPSPTPESTSTAKGETLKDTIKMVSGYADVVVMRNPKEGAAKAASLYSDVPVISMATAHAHHPDRWISPPSPRLRARVNRLSTVGRNTAI